MRLELLLRNGKRIGTSLMGNEEKRYMWNLAMSLHSKHGGVGLEVYDTVRSFITFHGIFMAPGYDLGEDSTWRIQTDDSDW